MSAEKEKTKVTFWAESATEWKGKIEPFDDGPNFRSRMIEMESVARYFDIGYSRDGKQFTWTFKRAPTRRMCVDIMRAVEAKWRGHPYEFSLIAPKPEFLAREMDTEPPEPITTAEPEPEPVKAPKAKKEPGPTVTGDMIFGNVVMTASPELYPKIFDQLAEFMHKYQINHIDLGWKKYG